MEHDTEFTYFKTTDVVRSAKTELSVGRDVFLVGRYRERGSLKQHHK